jgi:hypothetical protein
VRLGDVTELDAAPSACRAFERLDVGKQASQ